MSEFCDVSDFSFDSKFLADFHGRNEEANKTRGRIKGRESRGRREVKPKYTDGEKEEKKNNRHQKANRQRENICMKEEKKGDSKLNWSEQQHLREKRKLKEK